MALTLGASAQTNKNDAKPEAKSSTKVDPKPAETLILPIPDKNSKPVAPSTVPSTDVELRAVIMTRLLRSQPLRGSKIEVEVKKGVAKLTGTVKSERLKEFAEYVVKDVKNVKGVTNLLKAEEKLSEQEKNGLKIKEAAEKNAAAAGSKPVDKSAEKPAPKK
jgi:hypothetical protein